MCFQVTPRPEKSALGRSPFGGYACRDAGDPIFPQRWLKGSAADPFARSGAGFDLGGATPMSLPAPGNQELGGYNQPCYWNAHRHDWAARGKPDGGVRPGAAPNRSVLDFGQKRPFLSLQREAVCVLFYATGR
jgi:hypothetical protein